MEPTVACHLHLFLIDILKTLNFLLLHLHQLPLLLWGLAVRKVRAQVLHECVDKSFCWQTGICNLFTSINTLSSGWGSSYFKSFGGMVQTLKPRHSSKTSEWPLMYGSRFQARQYNSVKAKQSNSPSSETSNLCLRKYFSNKMWSSYDRVSFNFVKGIPFLLQARFMWRHSEGKFSLTYTLCLMSWQRFSFFSSLLHFCLSWKRFKGQFLVHLLREMCSVYPTTCLTGRALGTTHTSAT